MYIKYIFFVFFCFFRKKQCAMNNGNQRKYTTMVLLKTLSNKFLV